MFRAQQNAFDDAVGESTSHAALARLRRPQAGSGGRTGAQETSYRTLDRPLTWTLISTAKATDENLTSENWEYILVRY